MDLGLEVLSSLTVFTKYAKYKRELKRREDWNEIIDRYVQMMCTKYPSLTESIEVSAEFIRQKKVLPSMRALQFAGPAMEVNNARGYNCAYLPIDSVHSFSETMFLLLGGSGVGYSVQKQHVMKLPPIKKTEKYKNRTWLIEDSIMGWADSIKVLMKFYFEGGFKPKFDFRAIRHKGARLVTAGGKAPGPEPLKICLAHIEAIMERKSDGEKLTPLECHDILCHIANSVLSGGIRRSAMISLFSHDDEEMITCKYGNWWELNEQRGRSNNSCVLKRGEISEEEFKSLWKRIEASGSGEPGIYWTNDKELGTNPCCFVGDTKLLTTEGYKSFYELEGESFTAINKNGEEVPATCWSTGNKLVGSLILSNKKTIECTLDHKFLTVDGEEREAQYLPGNRIMPFYVVNREITDFVKYGFIQGDGALGRLESNSHLGLEVYFGEKDKDVADIFNSNVGKQYLTGYNTILKTLGFSSESLPNRGLPTTIYDWSEDNQLQFLKGLYSANGSIITKHRISLKSSCLSLIQDVKLILESIGIDCYYTTNKEKEVVFSNGNYICKESYDLNITKLNSVLKFSEKIGFVHEYKIKALEELIKEKAPKVLNYKIGEIKEVFDFSLDDNTHWGVVEGVIAHNCEIGLRPFSFCNLCEVNVSDIASQEDLNDRVATAAFFGTLQAGFFDFHYLRPIWAKTTQKDALLGIGMTGIGSGEILKYDLTIAANTAKVVNSMISAVIGTNEAARITCIKPSGTTSLVLGTASGIHAWHSPYYLRTMRFNKNEDIAMYMEINHPELCEDDILRPKDTLCVRVPVKAPKDSIFRTETAIDTLERVKKFAQEWIVPGHISGANTNNVSATISIDKNRTYPWNDGAFGTITEKDEWEVVGEWMWENKEFYNGLSVLNYDGHTYVQAPFEEIIEEEYNKRIEHVKLIDLNNVIELDDVVDFGAIVSCGGGACEVNI